ncbi:hypothetical protein YM304_30490 [Ilumatobacter coccineus YM16-304]|uniref:DUF2029 domain-containing protein n=1 Tax=Ilumatobacter coccineus (strain NBRC 103263 / KCTC 29153 / YM16-304) TaxID=1313172 RepID=A0A6C7EAK4_ILUCY|nr:hypothetical protein YM304_30490 [Ilumatobacter coccineus YM16-304]
MVVAVGVALLAVAICIAHRSGLRHDYIDFTVSWRATNGGVSPWESQPYAYGPVFNLFAAPARIDELGPKYLFVITWVVTAAILMARATRRSTTRAVAVALMLVVNPLTAISVAVFGLFDVVVGAISLGAVVLWRRDRPAAAGVCLAIGVLLKLFPAVLVPVLVASGCRAGRRAHVVKSVRFLVAVGASTAVGFGLSALMWGPRSVTEPLSFGAQRGPKLMSIFRYLDGRYRPIGSSDLDVSWLSVPLIVVSILAISVWAFRYRVDPVVASATAMIATFNFYKVGHQQFVVVVMLLLALWVAEAATIPTRQRAALALYSCWYGLAQAGYLWTAVANDAQYGFVGEWSWVREVIGAPTFLIASWLIYELIALPMRSTPGASLEPGVGEHPIIVV